MYRNRFAGAETTRARVWSVLAPHYFQRWIRENDTVLDLGAGYCEFINQIRAGKKYAIDANSATLRKASPEVEVVPQDVTTPWAIPSSQMDVVFSSNFLEHLPTKSALQFCLAECHRVLRTQGTLLLLGPNIRFCSDIYWDFLDHHLPLSDRSVVEAVELCGFQVEQVVPRFLPFTMKNRAPGNLLIRAYLALPVLWRVFGKQFFIVGRKYDS